MLKRTSGHDRSPVESLSHEVETPSLKPGDKGMFTATFNQVLGTGYVFRFARMQCEYLRHPHKRFKLVKLLWNFREFQAFCTMRTLGSWDHNKDFPSHGTLPQLGTRLQLSRSSKAKWWLETPRRVTFASVRDDWVTTGNLWASGDTCTSWPGGSQIDAQTFFYVGNFDEQTACLRSG